MGETKDKINDGIDKVLSLVRRVAVRWSSCEKMLALVMDLR